jgi:signal transduction histidine kinase
MVIADENMIGGIIHNLCSNAVKFTPKGGKVTVSAKQLPDGWVEVSVMDSGIGMNK